MRLRHLLAVFAVAVAMLVAPDLVAPGLVDAATLQDDATTTIVNGEEEVVDNLQQSFDEDGDGVDVVAISALVAGLLGMLMGGMALARTSRRD